MSMFKDISCGSKDNEEECLSHARVVSLYARKFGTGQWSFIGPGSEKVVLYHRRQSIRNLGHNCRKGVVGIKVPETFTGRILFMSMFNNITCGTKDNEEQCLSNANLVSLHARRSEKGQLSFIGPGSEKCYCISEDSPQGLWERIAEWMLVEFAERGCPIFLATTQLSRGQLKSKGHGKLSIHYAADLETTETIFCIFVSANQLGLYGAVAEICEEFESLRERTVRPVVMGQSSSSLVLSVIKKTN